MTITSYSYADKTFRTFAEGATLKVETGSVRIMSDVWGTEECATYWDETSGSIRTATLGVWEYSPGEAANRGSATVDATPEVKAKVREYLFNLALEKAVNEAKNIAARPVKGSVVKVVSGRSGKGTVGPIVVDITRPYGMGYRSSLERKFAIATSDRKVKVAAANGKVYENFADVIWVWARNVELVETPEIDMNEVTSRALANAESKMRAYA